MRRFALVLLAAGCARQDDAVVGVADAGTSADAAVAEASAPVVDAGACSGIECAKIKLGFRRIFVGDTDRGEQTRTWAWRSLGANVDGLNTGYPATEECKPEESAPQYSPYDGDEGIDNIWGERLVPLLAPWDKTPTKSANEAIARGARTPVLVLGSIEGGLVESKLDASFAFVEAGSTPLWNGTDVRALTAASLVTYPAGTFINGIFDSGRAEGTVAIELMIGAHPLVLPVRGLRVRFELLPDHTTTGGVLSGSVSVADMTFAVLEHVTRTAPDTCGTPKLDALRVAIRQAADVLADGARDKTRRCDAISFGVGFDAAPIELRGVAAPVSSPAPVCP